MLAVWITGGVSRDGKILELFRSENVSQRFLQISCHADRRNRPCAFLPASSVNLRYSRCVQQYSYSYAIVRDYGADPVSERVRLYLCACLLSRYLVPLVPVAPVVAESAAATAAGVRSPRAALVTE